MNNQKELNTGIVLMAHLLPCFDPYLPGEAADRRQLLSRERPE
jgi:hypothetical protein